MGHYFLDTQQRSLSSKFPFFSWKFSYRPSNVQIMVYNQAIKQSNILASQAFFTLQVLGTWKQAYVEQQGYWLNGSSAIARQGTALCYIPIMPPPRLLSHQLIYQLFFFQPIFCQYITVQLAQRYMFIATPYMSTLWLGTGPTK